MTYEETTITQNARDFLQATLNRIRAGNWITGDWTDTRNGVVSHCMVGFLRSTRKVRIDAAFRAERNLVAYRALVDAIYDQGNMYMKGRATRLKCLRFEELESEIIGFNDSQRTVTPIRAVFSAAIRKLDVLLAGSDAAYREAQAIVEAELARMDAEDAAAAKEKGKETYELGAKSLVC